MNDHQSRAEWGDFHDAQSPATDNAPQAGCNNFANAQSSEPTRKPIVLASLASAAAMLRKAPELRGLIAYDQMQRHIVLMRPVPGSKSKMRTFPRPLEDADITAIQEWMQVQGMRKLGKDVCAQAIDLVAQEVGFHPV